jgi:hypothetical protein
MINNGGENKNIHCSPWSQRAFRECGSKMHVKKSIAKAQQDEVFKELLKIMGKNGGKVAYGERIN